MLINLVQEIIEKNILIANVNQLNNLQGGRGHFDVKFIGIQSFITTLS